MPVLRRPHDHHRDLRARLNTEHPSTEPDQDRHIMMPLPIARCPNAARLYHRSSADDGEARANAASTHGLARGSTILVAARTPTLVLHPRRSPLHATRTWPTQRVEPQPPPSLSP